MKLLMTLMMIPLLTGCLDSFSEPVVDVVGSLKNEPTVKSGMTSRDAAHLATYRAYLKAMTDTPAPVLLDIQAHDNQKIEITGLKSLKVYAPTQPLTSTLKAPERPKSALAEAFEVGGNFVEKVGRVVVPWMIFEKGADTSVRLSEIASQERQHNVSTLKDVSESGMSGVTSTADGMRELASQGMELSK